MGDNLNGIFANMIQGMGFIGCAPNRVYNMAPPDGGGVEATAEGTELTLHSAAAPLTALTLYGKSEQRTTTGAQLFDASEYVRGGFINEAGDEQNGNQSYNCSGFCKSSPQTEYVLSSTGTKSKFYYDVDKAFISYENTSASFTTPDNAEYIRFNFLNTINENNIMLNAGSTALPWEPYTGGAPSPSPDYPQEIKSVGDSGAINVTLSDGGSQSQTLPVQTPNGLPGIPVNSGGNYTDANGQQWVCDEVDFERGVYVQRIIRYTGPFYKMYRAQTDSWFVIASSLANIPKPSYRGFCNISDYYRGSWNNLGHSHWFLQTGGQQIVIHLGDTYNTEEAVEQFIEKNEIVVYYAAETPIETPRSPSELAAYAALRTYSPTTVVSNDAGAWMNVGYKATPQPMTMLARKR